MKIRTLTILAFCLGLGSIASAQGIDDLVRYSTSIYQGTARAAGAGNAYGAVGGDYGGIGINPAGLGLYRQNEFMATMGYSQTNVNGNYLGATTGTTDPNFNIGNAGLVFSNARKRADRGVTSGWLNVNWAIGFNRTANYNASTVIEGTNTKSSILNAWKQDANNQGVFPVGLNAYSYGGLGFNTYLLDPTPGDSTKYVDATRHDPSINVLQKDYIQTWGSANNISLSLAGNYNNKLFIGASFNVSTVSYRTDRQFTETNLNKPGAPGDTQYKSMVLEESDTTTGVGATATIGVIYKFNEAFRIGGSVQLPTAYNLTDIFTRTVTGTVVNSGAPNGPTNTASTENSQGFNYTLITPAKATLSAAVFFNQHGFLSVDYEYSDYSTASIIGSDFSDFNQTAHNTLQPVNNVRIGGEYRIEQFALRAGYNYISSPYKSSAVDQGYAGATNVFSLGAGIRSNNVSVDLTYQLIMTNSTYSPYTSSSENGYASSPLLDNVYPSADIALQRSNLMLTFSARF